MQDFSNTISGMEDCEAILEYVHAALVQESAIWFSYHFTPIFESQTSRKTFIWARDYPIEVQRKYIGEDFRKVDPVPQLTFAHGPVLSWSKAMRLARADRRARRYVEIMDELEIVNWASFALFGPKNRDAFAAIRFSEDPETFARGRLGEYHSLLLTAHLQICKIMDESRPSVALSDREREVLEWMGRGKSSGDIAAILSISPETVRTYTRRIYQKLEASDRVTATVRALKLGLIEL